MDFFNHLDPFLKTYWFIAIPTSVIFLIQTILTFTGADASDGVDADFNGDLGDNDAPFQLFSLRNLINFLLGFSWSGIAFYSLIPSVWALIAVSFITGIAFLMLFFVIIRQLRKLEEDNSFKPSDTLQKTAEVYLTIPANKQGKGKISISIKGALHELDAMTTGEAIPSGSAVRVVGIENQSIYIVTSI